MKTQAPILYYFQEGKPLDRYAFRFEKNQRLPVSRGPFAQSGGLLVTPFLDCAPPEFSEDYKWTKIDGLSLGILPDLPPSAFERKTRLRGHPSLLGDGRLWTIPVALLNAPNFTLPSFETMDEKGNWIWKVQERYEFLAELAKTLFETQGNELAEDFVRNACCALIGVNYDLIDVEIAALGLLTRDAYEAIVASLLDKPGLADLARRSLRSVRHANWLAGRDSAYEPTMADALALAGGSADAAR